MNTAQRMPTRSSRWLGLPRALALQLRELWQRLRADGQRRRIERDTRAKLRGLDGRMLRDLGAGHRSVDAFHQAIGWLFVTVNAARTAACVPQIRATFTSSDGARGVCTLTWGCFALSHLTGAAYSLDVARDPRLFGAFLGNFVACSVLLGVVVWRRHRQRARHADLS